MEIPPLRPHFIKFSKPVSYEVLTSQHSLYLEVFLLSKFGLKGEISIDADSGSLR
jgi:hypothetical protein